MKNIQSFVFNCFESLTQRDKRDRDYEEPDYYQDDELGHSRYDWDPS